MENIKNFIQELEKCEETYEIGRWQLRVMTYLNEVFGGDIVSKFQSLNINDNPWDGSASQRGYLEALVAKMKSSNKNIQVNQATKKRLTYELFIHELGQLITSGETLYNLDQRDLDPNFRNWRLQVTDLIDRITRIGYSVRCYIRSRSFGTHRNATEMYLNEEYNRELRDTLNELNLIIKRYDDFGVPKANSIDKIEAQGLGKVFLGHGRSLLWNRVHRFLKDELSLEVIDFETKSRASSHIVDILKSFLDECNFAVIVMTAEDETADGKVRSRQNVIHEIGLFQGRHGFDRVLIFQQEEVEGFSNIAGLQTIRFKDKPENGFYELGRALEKLQQANQANAADS
jgi:hypothetical protein